MERSTSIFLDLSRSIAALAVFIAHLLLLNFDLVGDPVIEGYLQTAVIAFFVMSGFVIAYVADEKEKHARQYLCARLARLHSVIVPALILTCLADAIGYAFSPALYHDGPWYIGNYQPLRYLAAVAFSSYPWQVNLLPGSNTPFWSITYEAAYYALFAACIFLTGWRRWASISLIALVAGPSVIALLPTWLAGLFLYRASKRGLAIAAPWAATAMIVGALMLMASPWTRGWLHGPDLPFMRPAILADYADAAGFSLLLAGFIALPASVSRCVVPLGSFARKVGGFSFALYLFHAPLVFLLIAVLSPYLSAGELFAASLLLILVIVATLGHWCEKQKTPLRRAYLALWDRLAGGMARLRG